MSFLILLPIVGLWLALCGYWAYRTPKWLGIRSQGWLVSLLLFPLIVVLPAIQDIVGMRQFDKLCKERAVVWVSPDARKVKRAKDTSPETIDLTGYWISIRLQRAEYSDVDTGKPFLTYAALHTKGGLLGGIASLGNSHSCWPKDWIEVTNKLDIEQLIKEGKTK